MMSIHVLLQLQMMVLYIRTSNFTFYNPCKDVSDKDALNCPGGVPLERYQHHQSNNDITMIILVINDSLPQTAHLIISPLHLMIM
jgi:hypothetical protein